MVKEIPKEAQLARALGEVEMGKESMERGDFVGAKHWFQKSMDTFPTAEGYTYFAWMLSFEGEYDKAINFCKKAIELDEDFGNPYNDIGSYLIAKGQLDEAIGWLERAKVAKRYEPRHFPYTNLGRIYLRKGLLKKARQEFSQALKWIPESEEITKIMDVLDRSLN